MRANEHISIIIKIASPRKRLLAVYSSLLFFLMTLSVQVSGQQLELSASEFFGSSEGFSRYYHEGTYLLVNESSGVIHVLNQYKSVGDFHGGRALVESKDGKFGLIDQEMQTILKPEWEAVKLIAGNFAAVASHTGNWIKEDRGRGIKNYPELSWQLVDIRNQVVFSHMKFSNLLAVYGEVRARTTSGDEVTINLNKINVGYSDPLMKAVSYLNR